jgi:hypothetical protein
MVMTQEQKNKDVEATIGVIKAVADVIRELGSIPSGHLYARLIGHLNIDQYNTIIGLLKRAGLVEENAFMLRWIGPKI